MNWKFWKKSPVEQKALVLGTSESLGSFLIFGTSGSGATPASALNLYDKSTAVSIPINMVAESFASITPVIKIDDKVVNKHPILDLLAAPSPFFTESLFLETVAKDYLITGEAEIVALGSVNRSPLELQPVSPRNITVNEGSGGLAESFIVSGNTLPGTYMMAQAKKRIRYLSGNLRELKQIRNYSTQNNSLLRGQSPLKAASAEARQHIEGNNHNVSILQNGGRVSLVFHFDSDMNADDFKATKERVIEQYGGSSNAGQIGVTAGGKLDIKELGINNKDMDFANLQSMAQRAVALQYRVPLPLITTDASTFNNYAESKLALYDDAVLPLADRIFAGLTQLLVPRYGLDPAKVKITYDLDQITALEKRRNENLSLRRELNLETLNELREMIGREEVEGGNTILAPANLLPIGTDLFTVDNKPIPEVDDVELARDE